MSTALRLLGQKRRDVTDDEIDILPDGSVYLTQTRYRRRLVEAFGPGGWGMKPLNGETLKDNILFQKWALVVDGHVVGSAVGKAEYFESGRTDMADAAETVKSNALMRCCKDLGIAWQCWDKRFTERYRRERCVQVRVVKRYGRNAGQAEILWRRTDAEPLEGEVPPAVAGQPATVDAKTVVDVKPVAATALATKAATIHYPSDVFAAGQQAGWSTKYLNSVITERCGKSVTALKPGEECARAIQVVIDVRAAE